MKWLAVVLFTVICRPGIIWEVDGTSTELLGKPGTFDLYELEYLPGGYLYISEAKDSVWFYVEDRAYYSEGDSIKFIIQN